MYKRILSSLTILGMVAIFTACSSDKKDTPDNPENPDVSSVKMVLVEMRGNYTDDSELSTPEAGFQAQYDNKGRITAIRHLYDDKGWSEWETISYSDSKIIFGNKTFEVKDGRITKSSYGDIYEYDSNGQLVKTPWSNITWENGNIIAASDSEDDFIYSYTNLPNVGNLNAALNQTYSTDYPSGADMELALSGYFGTPSKNLCKSISYDVNNNKIFDREFEYLGLNEYGYPSSLKITDMAGYVQIFSLVWEKL